MKIQRLGEEREFFMLDDILQGGIVKRFLVSLAFIAVFSPLGLTQVVFDGPKETTPGQMVTITFAKVEGKGLSTTLLKNGIPATEGLFLKTLDDKPVFFIVPQQPATYTLIAAIAVNDKTVQTVHVLEVKGQSPTPPEPDELKQRFAAALQRSPQFNPDNLAKLAEIFEEVAKQVFPDTNSANQVLKATVAQYMAEDTLRPLRAEIAAYLRETVANDPKKITRHFNLVAKTLKQLR